MDPIVLTTSLTRSSDAERKSKRRKLVVRAVGAAMSVVVSWYNKKYLEKSVLPNYVCERDGMLMRLYNGNTKNCYKQLRLTKESFHKLCSILRENGYIDEPYRVSQVTLEEALAMFLNILGHSTKFGQVSCYFMRSNETISRSFGIILSEILKLGKDYIKVNGSDVQLAQDKKWKWFKDCVGALDGTYVPLTVPIENQGKYRNRKQQIATNVLGVCDATMKFKYVLPGWEGSASDSRILRNALTRSRPFMVPTGKYYLVDVGYTNSPGFLAPYRSTRYHLNEWAKCGRRPATPKELFNLRHSSARNVIERTFGLLKKRWAILRAPSFFDVKTQARPEAYRYRGKTIDNWDDLVTICGQDRATGEGAETCEEATNNITTNLANDSDSEEVTDTISTTRGNSQRRGSSSNGPKKRPRYDRLAGAVNQMAISIDKLSQSETCNVPPQKILDLLSQINDLEQSQLLVAFDILLADGRKFEALSCLPDHLKKPWLLMQIERVAK